MKSPLSKNRTIIGERKRIATYPLQLIVNSHDGSQKTKAKLRVYLRIAERRVSTAHDSTDSLGFYHLLCSSLASYVQFSPVCDATSFVYLVLASTLRFTLAGGEILAEVSPRQQPSTSTTKQSESLALISTIRTRSLSTWWCAEFLPRLVFSIDRSRAGIRSLVTLPHPRDFTFSRFFERTRDTKTWFRRLCVLRVWLCI